MNCHHRLLVVDASAFEKPFPYPSLHLARIAYILTREEKASAQSTICPQVGSIAMSFHGAAMSRISVSALEGIVCTVQFAKILEVLLEYGQEGC